MSVLPKQIVQLFADIDPDVKDVVIEVLSAERELMHLERPRGVMERIDNILDRVSKNILERQNLNED